MRIEPATAALQATDPTEPAHHEICFILALAAPLLAIRVARLGAHPDPVVNERLAGYVISAHMEMIIPLGVLQDHFDIRSFLSGRNQYALPRHVHHQVAAKPAPRSVTPGSVAFVTLTVSGKEVIDHDLWKEVGRIAKDFLELLAGGWIRHAIEPAFDALAAERSGRHAAAYPNACLFEELLGPQHRLSVNRVPASVGLEVYVCYGRTPTPLDCSANSLVVCESLAHFISRYQS